MTKSVTENELGLPELRVDVVEGHVREKERWVRCKLGTEIRFNVETLKTYCLAAWQPVVYDAFLVAAAIEFCDRVKRRPRRGWARAIQLRVPVHDPDRWNDPAVANALHDALNYLTGDCWKL